MYDTISWVTDTWFTKWNLQNVVELHGLRPTWYLAKFAFCTNAFFHVFILFKDDMETNCLVRDSRFFFVLYPVLYLLQLSMFNSHLGKITNKETLGY